MAIKISAVVPTYNRPGLLKKNIQALVNQTLPKGLFEILICDDGSTDRTREIVEEITKKNPTVSIRYFYQPNSGPAAARNMGIANSKGGIIAFTDDDCQPDPDWLAQIEETFKENPKIIGAAGVTYSDKRLATPFTHQIENFEPWSFPTCNVAYVKKTLEKVGGFDKSFPFTNEDADISWRMEEQGKVCHNPKMRVLHPPRPTTFVKELRSIQYLESEFKLLEKMPEEYKKRKINPYREILYVHNIRFAAKRIVNNSHFIFKHPLLYLKLVVLVFCQTIYRTLLMPGFIYRHYKRIKVPKD